MAASDGNPWKAATFALAGVMLGALATAGALRHAGDDTTEAPAPAALAANAVLDPAPGLAASVLAPASPEEPASPPASAKPRRSRSARGASAAPVSEPLQRASVQPAAGDVAACQRVAATTRDKAIHALQKGLIGGAIGAAVGAASGAIADGGSGAGKGAGIGGIVGAAAGTAWGVNESRQADAQAEAAYQACLQRRGYTSYAGR